MAGKLYNCFVDSSNLIDCKIRLIEGSTFTSYQLLGSACFAGLPRRLRITGEVCVYDNYTYWGLRPQWLWVGFGARTKIRL